MAEFMTVNDRSFECQYYNGFYLYYWCQ